MVVYMLIVRAQNTYRSLMTAGLYVGEDIRTYIMAAIYARKHRVHVFEKPLQKVACMMDKKEFRSTWVANKAIYSNRKVIDHGGKHLMNITPGIKRFGKQKAVDRLIRKYGYHGTPNTLVAYPSSVELNEHGDAAAYLIQPRALACEQLVIDFPIP